MTLEQMEFIGVHGVLLLLWQAIYSLHHHILIHKVSFTVATGGVEEDPPHQRLLR